MPEISFPYGKKQLKAQIPEERIYGIIESALNEYVPPLPAEELIEEALAHPVGSLPLSELAKDKENIVLIASDHTRPVPSRLLIPPMLREIRKGNPGCDITILVATGCHRATSKEELINKFGEDIVNREKIIVHNCRDNVSLTYLGKLPSGGELIINSLAAQADLLVSEGFIEPHFFAGFSGGRKSILPGIASAKTVMYNHNAEFIADPLSRTGVLEGNPIHRDMLFAAKKAGLSFILNVVLNSAKNVVFAVSGEPDAAHKKGCEFLNGLCRAEASPSDIVISTNGGYPLDQNIYQSVKGMTAAEAAVRDGGVIIMLSECSDGCGGDGFYESLKNERDNNRLLQSFLDTPAEETIPDQWQTQIFARVLLKASVVFVSDAPDYIVRDLHMIPAHSVEEAISIADSIIGDSRSAVNNICLIPDGVSVIVSEK